METRLRLSPAELLAKFDAPPDSWWFYFEAFFPLEYQDHKFQVGQPKFLLLTRAQQTLKVCQYIYGCTVSGGLQSAFYQDLNAVPHLPEHVRAFGWSELTKRFAQCLSALTGDEDLNAWIARQNAQDAQEEEVRDSWGGAGLLQDESGFEAFNEWLCDVAATPEGRAALRRFVEATMSELVA